MGKEPLLQKLSIQDDIESTKNKLVIDDVVDGDGPVTFILLFTTFTALCGTFSYGTAVIFFVFIYFFFFMVIFCFRGRFCGDKIQLECSIKQGKK